MITHAELEKLRSIRAPDDCVLSVYLPVPLDPAGLRGLPARASDLIRAAGYGPEDERAARDAVAAHARENLGQTLAIFVCCDLGLLEVVTLPGHVGDRAVWAVRPHIRPLQAALQRHPDHRIVIIDKRRVWLLAVIEGRIDIAVSAPADSMSSSGFAGWDGPASFHAHQRITEFDKHHFRAAAAILDQAVQGAGSQPLVIGGHADGIKRLLAELPHAVRAGYAGCFAVDPHTLTPARARELAAPVIAAWAEQRERQMVDEVAGPASGVRAAIGLNGCLAAVNSDAADLLLIPDAGIAPGYLCERCGVLSVTGEECCDWGAASRPVPDLLEEMALRIMHDGYDVISVREPQFSPVARLHQQVGS